MTDAHRDTDDLYGNVVESFLAQLRRGEAPSVEDYARRYPEMADEIRQNMPTLLLLEQVKEDAKQQPFPSVDGKSDREPKELKRLGDYRLVREIGRGGMGIVYQAEQESLGRHVAVKVLAGHALLDPKYLTRFRREARAAARLHHTNIVPVLDVGECQGIHYFVMQYIQGHGLDQVIAELRRMRDTHNDTTTSLLPGVLTFLSSGSTLLESNRDYWRSVVRIGLQAAGALAFAHAHDILHRDVKPSNLLLDEEGTTWVSDFGLAKSAEEESVTRSGDVLGTLRYMAPESFQGQFDARSDIYGLGLTLYEMCALEPARTAPHRNELIRQITHGDVPRLQRIHRDVPRDLETIVHKAIDPDPRRRYQTAGQLAADLECFLEDRPIRARRIGAGERCWRWCRRNPTIAVAVLISLVTFGVAFGVVARSRREAIEALADAQTQRGAAEARRIQADEARQLAETRADDDRRNFRWAKRTVDKYLTEISQDPLLKAHGMEPLRQRLLQTARQFYDEFVNVKTDDAGLQLERAKAYRQLASISDDVGDKTQALELLSKSRAILQKASTEDVDPIECRFESATNHKVTGKIYFKLGQFPEAQAAYQRSLKLLRELTRHRPQDQIQQRSLADVLGKLGVTHLKAGRVREAEALLDEAVTILDLLIAENPGAENPQDAENQEELAGTHSKRSILYALTKRPEPSEAAQRRAIEIRQRLVKQHPHNPRFHEKLAVDYMNAANGQSAAGRNEDALSSIKASLEMLKRLRDSHPNVELYQVNLAHGYRSLGRVYFQMGQSDDVETSYREAAAICEGLIHRYPDADVHRETLATIWGELGTCCERLGRPEQAEQARQKADAVRQMRQ